MAQEAKGNKASVTTSGGCQRQFEEPYAGKPQVRFRGGAAAAMPTAYSTGMRHDGTSTQTNVNDFRGYGVIDSRKPSAAED